LEGLQSSLKAVTAKQQRLLILLAAARDLRMFADKCSMLKQFADWLLLPKTEEEVQLCVRMLLLTASALANGLQQLQRHLLQRAQVEPPKAALLCLQELRFLLSSATLALRESCSSGLAARVTDTGEPFMLTAAIRLLLCCATAGSPDAMRYDMHMCKLTSAAAQLANQWPAKRWQRRPLTAGSGSQQIDSGCGGNVCDKNMHRIGLFARSPPFQK
jgi:hypothetical protein